MMRVEIEGVPYLVEFRHIEREFDVKMNGVVEKRRITRCNLRHGVGLAVMATEDAICRPPDQYDRERGRKLALGRALRKLFPGWEGLPSRREVWTAYLGRPRPKSQPRSLKEVVDATAVG